MFWVQDYIWELEYECPNRAECRDRTPDTHLPTRPNETYFRYTTPNIIEVLKVNDELKTLQFAHTRCQRGAVRVFACIRVLVII